MATQLRNEKKNKVEESSGFSLIKQSIKYVILRSTIEE